MENDTETKQNIRTITQKGWWCTEFELFLFSGWNTLTLITQFDKCTSCKWATDLQSFGHNWWSDQFVWWDFLVQFLIRWLIEQHLIVQLVTNFSFWPLLFLGFAATSSFLLLLGLLWLLGRRFCILLRCLYNATKITKK